MTRVKTPNTSRQRNPSTLSANDTYRARGDRKLAAIIIVDAETKARPATMKTSRRGTMPINLSTNDTEAIPRGRKSLMGKRLHPEGVLAPWSKQACVMPMVQPVGTFCNICFPKASRLARERPGMAASGTTWASSSGAADSSLEDLRWNMPD
jgi:hypothetical protein